MNQVVAMWMVALVPAVGAQAHAALGTEGCQALVRLELQDAKVVSAETLPAGAFSLPANVSPWLAGDPALYKRLGAFCRAVVRATPSADSDIQIEVWLPATGWNGKLLGQGNGGYAGEIHFGAMARALDQGYATAGTDTGHSGGSPDASWAIGHPEKVTDFGYRGIHLMTQIAKGAIQAYYGSKPKYSYFASCSNGGRQALMEAQRFPEDYDGILAGAPVNFWTRLLAKVIADAQATTLDPASYIPASKIPALARAVNAVCDAADGLADGVLNDPRQCLFDPAILACKEGDADTCLTPPQVTALQKLYAGPRDSGGRPIFPGTLPGAEEGNGGWTTWITGSAPGDGFLLAAGKGYFGSMVYERADWNYRTANVEQILQAAEAKTAAKLDATDANLAAFKARGGKLILYHGWNDPAIPALATVGYYDSVTGRMGRQETDAFVRLYMVPGMQHCGDGPGANSFGQWGAAPAGDPRHNVSLALEHWVEKGDAPSSIVATKYVDDDPAKGVQSTRPLCPYPQIARYRGQGDPRDAAHFACVPGG